MSISGGLSESIRRGESIGCTAIQIFTKNNRQWRSKPLETQEIVEFHNAYENSPIISIVAHASYLINLASHDPECVSKSIDALIDELNRCHTLHIPYLVLHPGSRPNTTIDNTLRHIINAIDQALEASHGKTIILLETMAGQGNSTCHAFEHLATIINASRYPHRLGVCFDTCHAFAAGYNFSTEETYSAMWSRFNNILGLDKLHLIHMNDSKGVLGSRLDRHDDIGKGKIGIEAFRLLCNDPQLLHIPKILETPYVTIEDHKRNLSIIHSLLK
jgi:deoxyribonuclease-4